MKIITCNKGHSQLILDILNEAIVNSTALYDYVPRPLESMGPWFDVKSKNNFPVIGLVDEGETLVAFGSYGTFRSWPAYKYTVEHSLYVHKDHRGKGYGRIVLNEIIKDAKNKEYHTLIAGIDSLNNPSKQLHESSGFEFCGRIKHAGYKFSKWLDLEFYQLLLSTPVCPKEQ
ncbi:GNAT family N-acetyltransferase [Chryseolinea sp. H1M3-3]|uniref:GNAT family N-acetyltransferase n=1 Tax=Chryseolinea sp. H1M3-3 TaxID=3034144 RepID=UPI0023ED1A4B|nr:GNAT family N-acetyltransferase [Chryseolinea sp. H1M3-3]